jgi:hypothetical protein
MLASWTGESGNSRWADTVADSSLLGQPCCRWVLRNTSDQSSNEHKLCMDAHGQSEYHTMWHSDDGEGGGVPDEA